MGKCKHCGKPAGLFRDQHKECEQLYEDGKQRIINEAISAIRDAESFNIIQEKISQIEKSFLIPSSERQSLLIRAWEKSVEQFLEDGILDQNEEKRLLEFMNHFALSQKDLDKEGAYTKITKAAVLRDILNGIIPKRINIEGDLPVNLQKNEQVVWVFPDS